MFHKQDTTRRIGQVYARMSLVDDRSQHVGELPPKARVSGVSCHATMACTSPGISRRTVVNADVREIGVCEEALDSVTTSILEGARLKRDFMTS